MVCIYYLAQTIKNRERLRVVFCVTFPFYKRLKNNCQNWHDNRFQLFYSTLMHPFKNISRNIVITGTLFIWAIKFFIRPLMHIPQELKPIVGLMPNLIGSFLLPFGACWLFQRIFGLLSQDELTRTCYFGLLLVIINEYLQLIPFFDRTFDYLDILSSIAGVFIGHLVFAGLLKKYAYKTYP